METEIKETENKEVSQDGLRNEEEERKFEAEVKRQEQEELRKSTSTSLLLQMAAPMILIALHA